MKSIFLALLFFLPHFANAIGAAGDTAWPEGATLEVQLKLSATLDKDGKPNISGALVIRNPGQSAVTVQHPTNRRVLAFFVSDELGNPVAPAGLAKVDPGFETQSLAARESLTHPLENLDYVTGSALFGYTLKPGKTYRIIAVYRAAGPRGPGFTSQETELKIPQ